MSNYNSIKAIINANVKTNGKQEISGSVLNSVLNAMVNALGAGYQYAGVATPDSNPGTPDTNVVYIAATAGTYAYMGGLAVAEGEVAILKYDGTWTKDVTGAATAKDVSKLGQDVSKLGQEVSQLGQDVSKKNGAVYDQYDAKTDSPTRNGSFGNPGNVNAVVWLNIPCAGYDYIHFRINKPFAAAGDIYVFAYTLPNGLYHDKVDDDIANGFYQDDISKELTLSVRGLNSFTIQCYETSLPFSYPSSCTPLRVTSFADGEGLEYYFTKDSAISQLRTEVNHIAETGAATAEQASRLGQDVSKLNGDIYGRTVLKTDLPTRNGSMANAGNVNAVVWLNIPCVGCDYIHFRINKPFAAAGNIYVFAYTLPNGSYHDKVDDDIAKGFYQDTISKELTLSVRGLNSFTIQCYETSLPFSYPSSCTPLRVTSFANGEGLEYYFTKEFEGSLKKLQYNSHYWLTRYFEGKGNSFSEEIPIYGLLPGHTYRIWFDVLNWDMTDVIIVTSYRFAINYWIDGVYTQLIARSLTRPIQEYYDFTIPSVRFDYVTVGGRAAVGTKVFYALQDITVAQAVPTNQLWESSEVRKIQKTTSCGNQGLTIVGDKIIQFNAGGDNHSTFAAVKLWDKTTFASLTDMTHNLGHAATCDYCQEPDALVVGNGTSDTSIAPRLDVIVNASSKIVAGAQLSYTDKDIIHIELSTGNKEIGGSGLICCFGGDWRVVYLATGQNAPRKIFKCILGVGAEDFSDKTADQSDTAAWGTFIAGKSDSEYNGTLKVVATYTGPETQVYQGMCYRNGFIYLACGYTQPLIHKIRMKTNGTYDIVQTNLPVRFAPNGDYQSVEPEGLCFYDDRTLLVGLPAYGGLFLIEAF